MWAVFLFIMGLFGLFLINTFGVITTTNQQDYTLLKNATEAAMMDSVDYASYRSGFYLCIDNPTVSGSVSPKNFTSGDDYHILHNIEGVNATGCEYLVGEYKLNKDVFAESFIRRFAANINNNKSYQITIQEIVEYPPKVSVKIDTYNTYDSTESTTTTYSTGDYGIRNQIDSIIEEYSD